MPKTPNPQQKTEAELKQKRLADALRANLRRRKSQQRGRSDEASESIQPNEKDTPNG